MAAGSNILSILFLAMFLLVPLVIGLWLIIASRKRGPDYPACGGCRYNLSGTIGASTRCPECGQEFAIVGILAPSRSRNRFMLFGGIALLMVPLTCGGGLTLTRYAAAVRAAEAQQAAAAQNQAARAAATAQQAPPTSPADSNAVTSESPDSGDADSE